MVAWSGCWPSKQREKTEHSEFRDFLVGSLGHSGPWNLPCRVILDEEHGML